MALLLHTSTSLQLEVRCDYEKKLHAGATLFSTIETTGYVSQLSLCGRGVAQYYSFVNLNADNDITAVPDGTIDIIFQCSGNHPRAQVCGLRQKGATGQI